MKIFNSASRLVFILLALALVAFTGMGIVDSKDFITLAGMAFTYYFTRKNNTTQTVDKEVDTTLG